MQFTTQIPISKSNHPIDYTSKIVSLGSCFAENIGDKFSYFKFQNTVNPFGIIYNPVSIENIVSRAVHKKYFTTEDVFFHNELWHCFEVHSELSNPNKEIFIHSLNQKLDDFYFQIANASHCIITYGTSWVYRVKTAHQTVANCHKVPQNQFDKEILAIATLEKSLENTIALIQKVNAECSLIFTVSPVRHIKDGFVENQRSKAHLLCAIHEIINTEVPIVNYFPSYEIMMDELRDYRFYAEDMLHPNQVAIDYIWERFLLTQISESIYPTMQEVCTVQKGLAHRPFNPETESHHKFLHALSKKIASLSAQFPHIKF